MGGCGPRHTERDTGLTLSEVGPTFSRLLVVFKGPVMPLLPPLSSRPSEIACPTAPGWHALL